MNDEKYAELDRWNGALFWYLAFMLTVMVLVGLVQAFQEL